MTNKTLSNPASAASDSPAFRLLALDLDGTLLDDHFRISERNRRAIQGVLASGVRVVILTGRRFKMAAPYARELKLATPLVVHNGALAKNLDSAEHVFLRPLALAKAARIIELGRQHQMDPVVFLPAASGGRMLVETVRPENIALQKYLQLGGEDVQFEKDLQAAMSLDPIQVMFSGRVSRIRELSATLRGRLDGQVQLLHTLYPARDFAFLDVLEQGATKGSALRRLAEHWHIEPSAILAIGDNANDLEMLRFAGKGVLMGNAEEELWEPAFERTAGNNEDGVAAVLERYWSA